MEDFLVHAWNYIDGTSGDINNISYPYYQKLNADHNGDYCDFHCMKLPAALMK